MVSKMEDCWADFPITAPRELSERLVGSYGGMTETFNFLFPIEQLQMQGLNKWWYDKGVKRVQISFKLPDVYFFPWKVEGSGRKIIACSLSQGMMELELDPTEFSQSFESCHIERNALFCVEALSLKSTLLKIKAGSNSITY